MLPTAGARGRRPRTREAAFGRLGGRSFGREREALASLLWRIEEDLVEDQVVLVAVPVKVLPLLDLGDEDGRPTLRIERGRGGQRRQAEVVERPALAVVHREHRVGEVAAP